MFTFTLSSSSQYDIKLDLMIFLNQWVWATPKNNNSMPMKTARVISGILIIFGNYLLDIKNRLTNIPWNTQRTIHITIYLA